MTSSRRPSSLARFRALLAAVVLTIAALGLQAAPVRLPAPLDELLKPAPVAAAFCASNPNFTGRLTANSGSTSAISRVTSANTAAYISNVAATWSCTNAYRYSGIGYNTSSTLGTFDWGNLINATSGGCNWATGTTDFVKANSTTDCPDSDAEYAVVVTLSAQGVYQRDVAHNSTGDLSFIHADCGTYYGGETIKTGQSFSGSDTGNRPGANCDPLTLDDTATSQTITYDSSNPTVAITAPGAGPLYLRNYATYVPTFNPSDNVAGFGGSYKWSLQRQTAPWASPSTCSTTWTNDGAAIVGTAEGSQSAPTVTLTNTTCYRWKLTAEDQNGNGPVSITSGAMLIDRTAPTANFTTPDEGTTTVLNATSYSVDWTEADAHTGIASRSLQRKVATYSGGACGSYANDGSAVTTTSPVNATSLVDGKCYQWVQTLTDTAQTGNSGATTSGTVRIDTSSPSTNFTTPNEGTCAYQTATSLSVAWSETAGSGSITSRSLQRQSGAIGSPNTCTVTWANDGSPATGASPVNSTGLANATCYRWIQTLTNSAGKSSATTSGVVCVDTTAAAGTIGAPAANQPLAGDVGITGSATDGSSFKEYQLEYGAGTSPGSWTSIGTFTSQVTATNPLATWSTAGLTGVYTLRLTVRDNAGTTPTTVTRLVYLDNTARGSETYYTRQPFELSGGWTLDVGVHNGEARLARDLFSIPSYGPPQALSLRYSSAETATTGRFGAGWVSNLTQYLSYESGFVVWHRADGGRVPFGQVSGTWTALDGHHEVLTRGGSEDTITAKDQSKLVFDNATGRLKRIEDRFANTLTFSWSASSATVTDASSRVTTITIDSGNDRITGVSDSAGRTWAFGYTGTDLTTITDPASKVTTLGYDGSHHLTSVSRSRSRVSGSPETITWAVAYSSGKVSTVTDPIDATAGTPGRNKFSYPSSTTTTLELLQGYDPDQSWLTTDYTFDAWGRPASWTDAGGATTSRTYDGDGNILTVTTPVDEFTTATTTSTYDASGNPLTQTVPIDASTSVVTAYSYNATNDVLTVSEADTDAALKRITKWSYDGSGHLTSVDVNCTTTGTTPPATASTCTGAGTQDGATNLITNYAYTANDQLEFEQDPRGIVTKHVYDSHGNETARIANCTSSGTSAPSPFDSCTAAGTADHQTNVTSAMAYDQLTTAGKAGLVTSATDPVGDVTTYTYDALGRQLTEVLPGDASIPALTTTTSYDELGNVLTEAPSWTPLGGGSPITRTSSHVYDLVNREIELENPLGESDHETTYDALGEAVETTSGGVTRTEQWLPVERQRTVTIADATTVSKFDLRANDYATDGTGVASITSRLFKYTGVVTEERIVRPSGDLVTTHASDALGQETSVDPPGAITATTTGYDRAGRSTTSTTNSVTTTTTYDRAGNTVAVKSPDGSVTATLYDPLGRATDTIRNCTDSGTTQPAAGVACSGLGTVNDLTNVRTRTYYDAAGQVIATQDAEGMTVKTVPNVRGSTKEQLANCTDSGTTPTSNPRTCTGGGTHGETSNVVTTTLYDGTGAAISTTAADGTSAEATTETAYDAAGRTVAVKDPAGTISRTVYNAAGQVTKTVVNCTNTGTTVPTSGWQSCTGAGTQDGTFNLTTEYAYDSQGNVTTETAPNDRVTTTYFDDAGQLATRIDNDVASPSGPTDDLLTEYFVDDAGRQSAIRTLDPDGSGTVTTRFVYNDDGTLAREIRNCTDSGTAEPADPGICGGAAGTTLGTIDASFNVITDHVYDAQGRRTRLMAPDPSDGAATESYVTTQYAYDAPGRLCRVVENATGSTNLQTLADPCTTATQTAATTLPPTNISTRSTYDTLGNLASAIDGAGHTQSYAYDALGRMTSRVDGLSATLVYAYDPLGNRIRQENRSDPPATASVTWTFDAAGRILTRIADGVTVTSTYDVTGNQLTAGDGTYTITSTYDRLGRVLTVDDEDAGGTADTTYTYSLTSPSWTDPTGTSTVALDNWDRPTSVDGPYTTAYGWTYGPTGAPLTMVDPGGNTTTYAYDDLARETSRQAKAGATNRLSYTTGYNRASQVVTASETVTTGSAQNTALAYDALGRLTSWDQPAGTDETYEWDKVANRTKLTAGGATSTTFDAADRPTTSGYSSDADGRLTARPDSSGQTFTWDHLGRLTAVKNAAGSVTIAAYTYDPLDRLRMIDYGGGTRVRFRYQGRTTSAIQLIDDAAGTVTRHVGTGWGGEHLLDWTGAGSNIRLYGRNSHHDVTWVASSAGAVTANGRYHPWGTLAAVSGTLPDFRFQGSYADATTVLSWVITRWYAPSQGRFLSEDSLLGDQQTPDSRHLYAYGMGDPVGTWDPDGMISRTFTFANRARFKGRLILSLFIRTQYSYATAPPWDFPVNATIARLNGDNRTWGPDCRHSRACIDIDFDKRTVKATVIDTCGDYSNGLGGWWGSGCSPQFKIVDSVPKPLVVCTSGMTAGCIVLDPQEWSLVRVTESSTGALGIVWDVTQSRMVVMRPDYTVNGRLLITPPRSVDPLLPTTPAMVDLWTDGFPSEEMYAYRPWKPRVTMHRWAQPGDERSDWKDMARGRGDRHVRLRLPTMNWP